MKDEGILKLYELQNVAEPGLKPKEQLVQVSTAYYAKVTYGITRIYAALGADRQFDTVVRAYNTIDCKNGMYVVLEDGLQYRVDIAQEVVGKDAYDLTLIRVEDYLDVYTGQDQEGVYSA